MAGRLFADRISAQSGKAIDRGDRADFVLHDKAGKPVIDDLRDRAAVVGDDRRSACHRLDHDQAKRFRPIDRHQQRGGAANRSGLRSDITLSQIPGGGNTST